MSVSLDALISSLSNKLIFKTYNADATVKNGEIRDLPRPLFEN